ncbi:hypothetical protein EDD36DRAFT_117200 [Exophiala viscosa]|uniref:Uncharacterized protein n=1 Tax=Exophiala viscosa TaxID=2486360 RepID=A0AAN6DMW8_9EURO|nr:hypothetical protein EDD36DRAFT_117200 [Exophiala viscosa]
MLRMMSMLAALGLLFLLPGLVCCILVCSWLLLHSLRVRCLRLELQLQPTLPLLAFIVKVSILPVDYYTRLRRVTFFIPILLVLPPTSPLARPTSCLYTYRTPA